MRSPLMQMLVGSTLLALGLLATAQASSPRTLARPGVHPPRWALDGQYARHRNIVTRPTMPFEARIISLPVDHSRKSTNETFSVHYYVDESHYNPQKPLLFLEMGGEGPTEGPPGGYIKQLAEKYGALTVSIEHRYYGQSIPFDFPAGYSTENLQYLTVDQALADVASLIEALDAQYPGVLQRTFTFGGSYSGALSAWMRMAYPNHTIGSLSSSGVVNAILDYTAFDSTVYAALQDTRNCSAHLERVMQAFTRLIEAGSPVPRRSLRTRADLPATDFYYMIADAAAMSVQYGSKSAMCEKLQAVSPFVGSSSEASDASVVSIFAEWVMDHWGSNFGSGCFYDTECVKSGPAVPHWVGGTARCWRWQKCTELAYLQAAPQKNSLRPTALTIDVLLQQCRDIFGVVPDTKPILSRFGGGKPRAGSHIYFSDFSDDPWQSASVTTDDLGPGLPWNLCTCDDCGHCDDLGTPSEQDPAPLKASRSRFEKYLESWLQ